MVDRLPGEERSIDTLVLDFFPALKQAGTLDGDLQHSLSLLFEHLLDPAHKSYPSDDCLQRIYTDPVDQYGAALFRAIYKKGEAQKWTGTIVDLSTVRIAFRRVQAAKAVDRSAAPVPVETGKLKKTSPKKESPKGEAPKGDEGVKKPGIVSRLWNAEIPWFGGKKSAVEDDSETAESAAATRTDTAAPALTAGVVGVGVRETREDMAAALELTGSAADFFDESGGTIPPPPAALTRPVYMAPTDWRPRPPVAPPPAPVPPVPAPPRAPVSVRAEVVLDPKFDPWKAYTSETLKQNIACLTPEERLTVDRLAPVLARDASTFILSATKPHATTERYGRVDHCSYAIRRDPSEFPLKEIDTALRAATNDPDLLNIRSPFLGYSTPNIVRIYRHPLDPEKVLLECLLSTPGGGARYDSRMVNNQYLLILPKDSEILHYLSSEENGRLFSFIFRNAAAISDHKSLVFVDTPFEGAGQFGKDRNPLVILDFRDRRVIRYASTSQPLAIASSNNVSGDNKKFFEVARRYDAAGHYQNDVNISIDLKWNSWKPDTFAYDNPYLRTYATGAPVDDVELPVDVSRVPPARIPPAAPVLRVAPSPPASAPAPARPDVPSEKTPTEEEISDIIMTYLLPTSMGGKKLKQFLEDPRNRELAEVLHGLFQKHSRAEVEQAVQKILQTVEFHKPFDGLVEDPRAEVYRYFASNFMSMSGKYLFFDPFASETAHQDAVSMILGKKLLIYFYQHFYPSKVGFGTFANRFEKNLDAFFRKEFPDLSEDSIDNIRRTLAGCSGQDLSVMLEDSYFCNELGLRFVQALEQKNPGSVTRPSGGILPLLRDLAGGSAPVTSAPALSDPFTGALDDDGAAPDSDDDSDPHARWKPREAPRPPAAPARTGFDPTLLRKVARPRVDAPPSAAPPRPDDVDSLTTFEFPLLAGDIGRDVSEGEIVQWHVHEGDTVRKGQNLCEILTDKATLVIPCPADGIVKRIPKLSGDMIYVGDTLVSLETSAHGVQADAEPSPPGDADSPASDDADDWRPPEDLGGLGAVLRAEDEPVRASAEDPELASAKMEDPHYGEKVEMIDLLVANGIIPEGEKVASLKKITGKNKDAMDALWNLTYRMLQVLYPDGVLNPQKDSYLYIHVFVAYSNLVRRAYGMELLYPLPGTPYDSRRYEMDSVDRFSRLPEGQIVRVVYHGFQKGLSVPMKARVVISS